ncbi:MAG: hypothetical protein ACR2QW_20095 [bacterium]
MKFSEKWQKAYDSRDRDAFGELIDVDFKYIRHLSGAEIAKEEMLDIWSSDGPRPERRNQRTIYENDDIVVSHQFIDFPSGDKEAVMVVILLKDGKAIRMETGATPMPS